MSLFLSRLRLSRAPSTRALDALLNPAGEGPRIDAHHRLLWAAFADGPGRTRDFLWRDEGAGVFLTLSTRPPAPSELFEPPEVKPFAPQLSAGDQLAFSLRANATRARKGVGRVDVVMDALHAVPKGQRAPERMVAAQAAGTEWLAGQGDRAGFRLLAVAVGDYSVVALPGHRGARRGQPQFGILDMTGAIEVTDPAALLPALAQGFGRAKAFGCGLMLIRRA
ncbi:MAG: type I-E CRISPR-associated protein Cas6/Cse3/CasE [Rhodobacteraceae bacterium]|nr:type I-E CRISPR-associated protein Cas6/Cse3/CasE [Paracoccaceae bacterium]